MTFTFDLVTQIWVRRVELIKVELHIVAVVLKPRSYKMPTFQEREKTVSFFYNDVLEIEIL